MAQALNRAAASLKDLGREVLSPEALLLTFVRHDDLTAHRILQQLLATRGQQWDRFADEVSRLARERLAPDVDFDWAGDDGRRTPLADDLLIALDEALTLARARDEVYVGSEHVLAGMTDRRVGVARLLERHGITPRAIQDAIVANGAARNSTTTDHVALARQGEITPVYFRTELLRDLIGLLTLASDRHVILVGAPGVGKRTLAYSLALLIAEGKGPAGLKSVVEINERALLDDPRLAVQGAVRRAGGGILFVPRIARFFGGFKAEFPEAAGKELQKAFFGRDVVVLGTATEAEYAERLQSTAAVSGHAHALRVEATSVEETAAILDVVKPRFEADYGLQVADASLKEVARLAGRYLTTLPLPASAVHLLHRTCALVKMGQQSSLVDSGGDGADRTVDAEDVMVTISQLTGIPVSRLGADERARYANMVEHLRQRIIGQDEAVLAVSRAVKTARVGLKDPKRPIGSFFFLGPTGVGKTELAKALAEFMFGADDAMIVLDMTEYQDENAVSRMIGAPPGYVGYEEGGQLTEKVATMPYAVVLFDEVEKAHSRVLDVLLQIMDEGRLTDGKGRTVSFREAVIILTSNIGSQYLVDPQLPASAAQTAAETELKRALRPEFLNRLTDIIFFNRLDDAALRNVLGLMLKKEGALLAERGITLEVSEEARTWLLARNDHPEWGARPLRRIIEKHIREPLADWMLREDPPAGSVVQATREGEELVFHKNPTGLRARNSETG
jgi:ATP-dependent Clp protease ATP-binding subunit ClpC